MLNRAQTPLYEVIQGTGEMLCSGRGKEVPQQARCGPEGSSRFRLPDFRDIRNKKVVRLSASRTGRLYPQEMFLVLSRPQGHGTVGRKYVTEKIQ
jgi:hypothetical protein